MIRLLAAFAVLALLQQEDKQLAEFKREALKKYEAGTWKKIAWQADMPAAIKKAQDDGKPILAVIVVGHLGKQGAAEC
jgi:hypothetical protein